MKKKVLSMLLTVCMLLSMLPTTALASNAEDFVVAYNYQQLEDYLADSSVTELQIAAKWLESTDSAGNPIYKEFGWPTGTYTLDLAPAYTACDIWITGGDWTIPSDVTVNNSARLYCYNNDIVVNGTWNVVTNQGLVYMQTGDEFIVNGKMTTPDINMQPAGRGTIRLNGRMEMNGGTCHVDNMILGDRAVVADTYTGNLVNKVPALWLADSGTISCPTGSAAMDAEIMAASTGSCTLSGNISVKQLNLPNGSTLWLDSSANITTEQLTAYDGTSRLAVDGTLTLNGSSAYHAFTESAVLDIREGGVVNVNPGNALGTSDSTGSVTGNGTIAMYAQYNETAGTYRQFPALFGETDNRPTQVANTVTITRNWPVGTDGDVAGPKLTYTYPADKCAIAVIDATTNEAVESGDELQLDGTYAYAIIEITHIADGYRIKSFTVGESDRTESMVLNYYNERGGRIFNLSADTTVTLELEEIPAERPAIADVAVYDASSSSYTDRVTFTEGGNNRLYAEITLSDGGEYKGHYFACNWEYSTDGTTWTELPDWGARTDFWADWPIYESEYNLNFVTMAYQLRAKITPREDYIAGATVYSDVIAVNGDPLPTVPAVNGITFTAGTTNGVDMNWTMETPEEGEPTTDDIDSLEFWLHNSTKSRWEHFYTGFTYQNSTCLTKIVGDSDLEGEYDQIRVYSMANGYDAEGNEVADGEYVQNISLTITQEEGSGGFASFDKDQVADKGYSVTMSGMTTGKETALYTHKAKEFKDTNRLINPLYYAAISEDPYTEEYVDIRGETETALQTAWYTLRQFDSTVNSTTDADITVIDLSGWKRCVPGECTEHVWQTSYKSDGTHHWYECQNCNEISGKVAHTPNKETITSCLESIQCTECYYYLKMPANHIWETTWTTDESGHWHQCENCTAKNDAANHSSSTAATCTQKAVCDACTQEYGGFADHSWQTVWTYDETSHWHKCANCDAATGEAAHDPVTDPAVAPTLTTEGKTEGSHCGTCEKVLVAQRTIAKLQEQEVGFLSSVTLTYGERTELYNYAYNESEGGSEVFTYSGNNPAVATVDANSGKVTIVGAGTATITATAAAVEGYVETSASYTLTVNKAPLTVTAKNKTIAYGQAPSNDGYTVTGLVNGESESVLSGTAAYTYGYEQYGNVGTYAITLAGLTANNYDITFAPGVLTVEKAAQHTITLGNLNQTAGSVSAVTAALAPQDSTAAVKVEYETVTAAKPCSHQHNADCGENGASCTHTAHDSTCGYAEEIRTWSTTVPTTKGTYNVRASLTASGNITVPAEPVYTTGTLEIRAQATIGGYYAPSTPGQNDSLDVDSGDQDVAVDVNVEGDSVEVIVTDQKLEEILNKVPATGEVVVDLTSVDEAKELVIPAKLVTALNETDHAQELTVVSEAAELTMDSDVMETLASSVTGTNDKVSVQLTAVDKSDLTELQQKALDSITVDAVVVELNLTVTHYDDWGNVTGESKLHELGGKADVRVAYDLPEGMEGKHVAVAYVSDNGAVTYLRASYVDGHVCFTTDHFSTYAVYTSYAAGFEDVDLNAWYAANVAYVAERELMGSVGNDRFDPEGATSRAMIVTILYRLEGSPAVEADMAFNDVAAGTWYTEAVRWANANGIVTGYNGSFDPEGAITREQMAAILWRYAKYKGMDVSVGEDTNILSYNDAFSVSEYAVSAMQWACGEGLINGIAGDLVPDGGATRAQVAAILNRFCEILK